MSACAANSTGETTTEAATDSGQTTNVADTTLEATGVKLGVEEYDSSAVIWGPGNIKEHQRPTDPVNLQNKFSELSAQWLLSDEKNICLTFDEGYENGYTAQILDTLKEKMLKQFSFAHMIMLKIIPSL